MNRKDHVDVEDHIRRALAELVDASPLPPDLSEDRPTSLHRTRRDDRRVTMSARVLAGAIALALVAGIIAVVVRETPESDGRFTTTGSEPIGTILPGTSGVPRVVPTWMPDGMELDKVEVRPVTPAKVAWLKTWHKPRSDGDRRRVLNLAVSAYPKGGAPELDESMKPKASTTIEVNGNPARVAPSLDSLGENSLVPTDGSGFIVMWDLASGSRLSLQVNGLTMEESLQLAENVTVDDTTDPLLPKATLRADAIPGGYVPAYDGPSYGYGGRGGAAFAYRRSGPQSSAPERGIQLSIDPTIGVDPVALLAAQEHAGTEIIESGNIRYMVLPGIHGGSSARIIGTGQGFSFEIFTSEIDEADGARIATNLRTVDEQQWLNYLSSAKTTPYPERSVDSGRKPLCDALIATSAEFRELERTGDRTRDEADRDGSTIRRLIAVAGPDLQADIETVAAYADQRYQSTRRDPAELSPPFRLDHTGAVELRNAARNLEDFSRTNCTEFVPIRSLGVHVMPLDEQDPRYDPFCGAWFALDRRAFSGRPALLPMPSVHALVPELDAAIALLPPDASELINMMKQRRNTWASTPEGQEWGGDPYGTTITKLCPDWPMNW